MQELFEIELFTTHTPPKLGHLFGYRQCRQWVAFFWGKKIGTHTQGYCYDGKEFSPLNQLAWDTFFNHPLTLAMNHQRIEGRAMKKFEFGDTLEPSNHWLLMDRRRRSLFAAIKPYALDHLKVVSDVQVGPSMVEAPDSDKPGIPSASSAGGALEMLTEMTAWLDRRKASLEETGEWPIVS